MEYSKESRRAYDRKYRAANLEAVRTKNREWARRNRGTRCKYVRGVKAEVLTHYAGGVLHCCWSGCSTDDIDMLTLDHIDDGGAQHRRQMGNRGGFASYLQLRKAGFPPGYQTLCCNHQAKKEIMRRAL